MARSARGAARGGGGSPAPRVEGQPQLAPSHDPLDQLLPLQLEPLQLEPLHELPDQEEPLHELPDHDEPLHELPVHTDPFQPPPDQLEPAASRPAIEPESKGWPKMSCSPCRTTPFIEM